MQSKVEEIHNSKKKLEEELRNKALAHMEVDKKINSLKPDLVQLRKIRDQYLLYVYIFRISFSRMQIRFLVLLWSKDSGAKELQFTVCSVCVSMF